MSDNLLIVTTELEGFINALRPSGKFNNCTISFRLSPEDLEIFDAKYQAGLAWGAKQLDGKRHTQELPKWEEDGFIKYSYGKADPEPGFTSKPSFLWVDADNKPIPLDTPLRAGTVVQLAIDLKPYIFGTKVGLKFTIKGARVLKAVLLGQAVDVEVDESNVADIFGAPVAAGEAVEASSDMPF
jgi:hypothetical protein